MAKVPEFLLKSLYVRGSLKKTEDGFVFKLKNELGPARIVGVRPIQFDRKPVSPERSSFVHGEQQSVFSDVSPENSVLLRKGDELTILVKSQRAAPGRHSLGINITVKDMGPLVFTITDQIK